MAQITKVTVRMLNLQPQVTRVDAIQSFISQETPMVTIYDSDGACGTGYSYTIGTGGPSIIALLQHTLVPALIGRDPDRIDHIWRSLLYLTHATSVGAITSLALAAIDTALWDLRCIRQGLPLWKAAGGTRDRIQLYSTEGGWLHLSPQQLADNLLEDKHKGFRGSKIKIGSPHLHQDEQRLAKVRSVAGDDYEIMTDGNQSFHLDQAKRYARMLECFAVAWFEEPLPADDIAAHIALSRHSRVPVAVGESIYAISQFKDYLQLGAASIVQVDVARIGGITPWLKVAGMAEAFNVAVCPHFLMELHLSLVCAVPNGRWLEYIPQLDSITCKHILIQDGDALAPTEPGIGIAWDWDAITRNQLVVHDIQGE